MINTLGRHKLTFAIPTTLTVLLMLAIARLVWHIPKPLLLVVTAIFLVWSTIFWRLHRKTERTAYGQITQVLLPWLLVTPLLLGIVYYVDRAGWIWSQLTGYNLTFAEDFSGLIDVSVVDFVDQYPFFSLDPQDSTKLILPKGAYDIHETIVVPSGSSLTIEPGTMLRFRVGRSLISYSPIIARGIESAPIHFTAQNTWRKWGVVGLVNTGKSIFEHVSFEHGRQALVNNIDFFGSLSLIETDVEIAHSQFLNLFGKDAVYVRQGRVLIRDNTFRDTNKDCLDLDGGSGEISHNQFINCGDEGIDLSFNYDIQVFDNKIIGSDGGRISADHNLDRIKKLNIFRHSVNN